MYKLVLIRHGQSLWNAKNLFTGWTDVELSEQGIAEAKEAGRKLMDAGYEFDICFTSHLKRAIKTLWLALDTMDLCYLPVVRAWQLNERHYGDLQGFNKAEMAEKVGKEQVHVWRRSYDTPPPQMSKTDERYLAMQERYSNTEVPQAESLQMTCERVMPYFDSEIAPLIKSGKRILISAHGNSLRALVKELDSISDADIPNLNIPTGQPLVYELDENLKPIKSYYL